MNENYVLLALVVAWLIVKLTTIAVRHQQAKRRDAARTGTP